MVWRIRNFQNFENLNFNGERWGFASVSGFRILGTSSRPKFLHPSRNDDDGGKQWQWRFYLDSGVALASLWLNQESCHCLDIQSNSHEFEEDGDDNSEDDVELIQLGDDDDDNADDDAAEVIQLLKKRRSASPPLLIFHWAVVCIWSEISNRWKKY